jgi:hypothetical protein
MANRLLPVVTILLCALPGSVLAQAPSRPRGPRPAVGAQVGYSRSDLGGPDAQRVGSRQGALTGVYLQAPLGGPFWLRPEVLFALKGGRTQASVEGGGAVELDIGLAYIEVPVLLRVGARRGRFRPLLFGGPAPALQIGCDIQIVDPTVPVRAACDETDLPAFRGFDLGVVVGGGLEVRWPQSALSLEARYTTGMRSVLDDVNVRNRAVGVVLALTF